MSVRHVRRAHRMSAAVASRFTNPRLVGRVHSVFRRALNVAIGEVLITIAAPSVGLSPNGLLLDEWGLPTHLIEIGSLVFGDGLRLVFPEASLAVTLTEAIQWSPTLRPIRIRSLETVRRNVDVARRSASENAAARGFGPLLRRDESRHVAPVSLGLSAACLRASSAIDGVRAALSDRNIARLISSAEPLIGLGEGLTPSGDDFVLGVAAALAGMGDPLGPAFARTCARAALGRTTAVAETFLVHAGRGEYSERIHRLLAALLDGTPLDVQAEIRNVLTWGATSGGDCLLGVLVGLEAGQVAASEAVLGYRI